MSRFKPLRVAVTGGIGSGKSAALNLLRKMGCRVYSADKIYRKLLLTDRMLRDEIRAVFGNAVFYSNGRLNRGRLAPVIFSDPVSRKKLNAIAHPRIERIISEQIRKGRGHVFVEVPLLYEEKLENNYDRVLLISASEDIRIKRLLKRGLSKSMINKRISSQLPDKIKKSLADKIIDNNGNRINLKNSLESYLLELK